MLSNPKLSLKRAKIKPDHSHSQVFHLSQSQRATTAKNELLYLTSINQKFYSTATINYRRNCPQLHQTYDSWHGESIGRSSNTQNQQKIQPQTHCKPKQAHVQREKYHRHLIQSADSTIFKKRRSSPKNQVSKLRKSIIQINSNNLSTVPLSKSLASSQHQLRASSSLMKRKIKTTSANCENRHSSSNTQPSFNKQCSSFSFVGFLPQEKVNNTGVLASSFKRKYQKKGNWLKKDKINSNLLRIEQFKASNSPLKKQIDKIIHLLHEQTKYSKILSYE